MIKNTKQKKQETAKTNDLLFLPKAFGPGTDMVPIRNGFGDGMMELGRLDQTVVALCCDLTESTKMAEFAKIYPERFVEVGVAEQNMAGLAAGMAHEGKTPFCTSYAVFSPGRNWDQIRVSICYSNNNVKIVGSHAGISVGPDGATHQAMEDIAMMRVLPKMVVLVPCDATEAKKATIAAAQHKGPVYLRLAREKTPNFTAEDSPFEIGKAQIFRKGNDCTVVACGPQVYYALHAAEELAKKGIECEVLNMATIKPLDKDALIASAKKTKCVVTAEEHQIAGGLGSACAEVLAQYFPVPMGFVGMPDSFGESGEPAQLLAKWGMDKDMIVKQVQNMLMLKAKRKS
jgi:transketolase